MPTFSKCTPEVNDLANKILREHESHQPLVDAEVKIDFVFAYGDRDDNGELINDALKQHGVRAYAITRKLPLKDRAMGRGDAEITIDHDHWETINEKEQEALLDHELHHIAVRVGKIDDLQRPVLGLRKHDFQVGWFKVIAERHGVHSVECQQAKVIWDNAGQLLFFAPTEIQPQSRMTLVAKSVQAS